MKRPFRPDPDDWVSPQVQAGPPGLGDERRGRPDRRRRLWWSLLYGSFNPRRRRPPRRLDEWRFHSLDWHGPHLLAVSIGILILNVADAFLTVALLSGGAIEVNPIMAILVSGNIAVFVALKVAVTGMSVMLMVFLARYRFMRLVRVEFVLYAVLAAYAGLIIYEIEMLQRLSAVHDL
jgi:hypothetical protein